MEHIRRLTKKRKKDVRGSSPLQLPLEDDDFIVLGGGYIPIEDCNPKCESAAPADSTCVVGGGQEC